jgi:hypothetical protein
VDSDECQASNEREHAQKSLNDLNSSVVDDARDDFVGLSFRNMKGNRYKRANLLRIVCSHPS